MHDSWGDDLTPEDYAKLEARWITRELADAQGFRRATSYVGQQMFHRKGDLAGMLLPNVAPWDPGHIREYRLRRDRPDLEPRPDGTFRETGKYIQPQERRNLLYFPVGITPEMLADTTLPLLVVEGEFKSVAAFRLAHYGTNLPRFVPVSIPGVYGFRGTIGKTTGPDGERRDVKGVIPDFDRISLKDRRVIIAYDADAEQNPKVRAARWQLSSVVVERGATSGVLEWPVHEGNGLDDWLAAVGAEKVLAAIAAISFGSWRSRLLRTEFGKLLCCHENAALMLENSPEWAGVVGYNEFTGGCHVMRTPPAPITAEVGEEITDTFDTEVVRWFERKGMLVKPSVVRSVVDLVAKKNRFHPVIDYLEALPPWDGVDRIGTWLRDYCGVVHSDESPNEFAMAAGRKFLISAVARILQPGCKVDHLLVLEGEQGTQKSTAIRILAGEEFFTDHLDVLGTKDCMMQLRGRWIVELSELDALKRTDNSRAKAFLSQQSDRFRLPYGHRLVNIKRQCVFMGSTNQDTWATDESGARRFWPAAVGEIKIDELKRDHDLLWAEALHAYRAGEPWWLEDKALLAEAVEEQHQRYMEDVWHGKVMAVAAELASNPISAPRNSASIAEILDKMGVETAKQDQRMASRVGRCLRREGWRLRRVGQRGSREYRYFKPPVRRGQS